MSAREISLPEGLIASLPELSEEDVATAKNLVSFGQSALFAHWEKSKETRRKRDFLAQVRILDSGYVGGLAAYVRNARRLLRAAREGANPFDAYLPAVPSGRRLEAGKSEFFELEDRGVLELRDAAFVLVAGGRGERLGYDGIKLELPTELTTR